MRTSGLGAFAWLPLMGALTPALAANDVVYVTDLAIYTLLAPCAQSAISYNVMSMTYDNCPEAVTDMQSCVCSKSQYFASLSSTISADVSNSCGSTASSDQSSASAVFSAYCNQDAVVTFPTPTVKVSQYITDIPEMAYLAPCASSQVSYAVMDMTYSLCPPDAANLATCVCQKNQNSLVVSQTINAAVSQACDSQTANIASAQAFFSAYCKLNAGTSSFPTASNPPGDMSYYITDMPQYSSMVRCAKDALSSAVLTNTYDLCPGGPQLLASCVCIKESMSSVVNSYITSNIKWDCSSNTADDISSALDVFDLYCSAARNEAVVSGITTSVSQTAPVGLGGGGRGGGGGGGGGGVSATGNGNKATASRPTSKATSTTTSSSGSSSAGSNSDSDSDSDSDGSPSESQKKSNTPVIVGAVVGVVAGLALLGVAAFLVFRHARKSNAMRSSRPQVNDFQQLQNLPPSGNNNNNNNNNNGNFGTVPGGFASGELKPELAGTPIAEAGATGAAMLAADNAHSRYGVNLPLPPPSPSLSTSKYSDNNVVSPQSPADPSVSPASAQQYGYPYAMPLGNQAELPTGNMYSPTGGYPASAVPSYSELQGQQSFPQQPQAQAELYGGQPQVIHQADSTPIASPNRTTPSSPGGMTYHSGPVPQTYSELDGSSPHAV